MARSRQLIDIAYSFFIALAIALAMIIVVEAVRDNRTLSEETAERVGFLLLFPVAVGIIAGGASFVLSIVAWQEWRLLVLSFLEIMSLISALTGQGLALVYFVVALYMAACITFSYQWFGLRRRRRL